MNDLLKGWLSFVGVAVAFVATGSTNATFTIGGDFRIRQEVAGNIPGLPGNPYAMMPSTRKQIMNHFRFRPRIWARADFGSFGLYARVADEFREYVVKNGQRRQDRNYNFPDELILDNLYFEGRDLFGERLDFRIGRQDLFDGRHSVLGLDRLMLDGAPYVGSRSCYADMIRITLKPTPTGRLDLFALYDKGHNVFSWGTNRSKRRPMNAIHPGDEYDMDEWGGGVVWYDEATLGGAYALPYRVYVVNKNNTAYTRFDGQRRGGKHVTALGLWLRPQLTESLFLEIEGAAEPGDQTGVGYGCGWMGYGAFEWREQIASVTPYARFSAYYLSHGWDPMWARAPCDSELFQYGTLSGLGFWSNMLYTKVTLGIELGVHHAVSIYTGPLWAAEKDGAGRIGGEGGSSYKGFLSAARYDFPIRLAAKNATGLDRFELFGHIIGEVFNPGEYYESGKPAWFLRWEVTFKF